MDWIATLTGIGGLVTGGISLIVMLREKRRTLKVALKWGIDPDYHKTSGIVLWMYAANAGYQPVVLNGAGLHVQGVPDPFSVAKPWTNKQFPLSLEPGHTFSTSISSEVLLEMMQTLSYEGKIRVRGYFDTVFRKYKCSAITIDKKHLEELVTLVKENAHYAQYKEFMRSIGGLSMDSFDKLASYLQATAQQGFDVRTISGLSEGEEHDDAN